MLDELRERLNIHPIKHFSVMALPNGFPRLKYGLSTELFPLTAFPL
ncbi:hypothetical protein [Paludifilum halophilum]|nr:hypothetical protein [Paludifilum halophilum]